EAGPLRAEKNRDVALSEFPLTLIQTGAQRLWNRAQRALAGARADHEMRPGHRLVQRIHHAGVVEHVQSAGSPRPRHLAAFAPRRHQYEARKPHHAHGPCRGADVAGMRRPDENDRDFSLHAHEPLTEFAILVAIIDESPYVNPLLNIAVSAARAGGSVVLRGLNRLDDLHVERKRHNDYVSEIDQRAEQVIIETIRKAHPDHAILAEESGASGGESDYQWIIDPLDGTTNYLHGFPAFAVSIAV